MNTKSNQRYQETDKKIQQVFLQLLQEKDLSHTTVQDICKGCGINRSTFYAHYTDVYDLLSKMEHSVGMDIFESFRVLMPVLSIFCLPPSLQISYSISETIRPFTAPIWKVGNKLPYHKGLMISFKLSLNPLP